jgi:hypothetical protein
MRHPLFKAALSLALLGTGACVGALSPTPPGGGDDITDGPDAGTATAQGKAMFDQNVQPILSAQCASCHVGTAGTQPYKFLGTGPTTYYATLTGDPAIIGNYDPAQATILTKGLHEGPALAQADKDTISAWLVQEATDRGVDNTTTPPPTGTPPQTSLQALAQFSGCMTIDDWNTSQVYEWANKGTDQGACKSCHSDGAGGYYANNDPNMMFMMNRYEVFIRTFFTTKVDALTGLPTVIVNETKIRLKSNTTGHPQFNPDSGSQMQYLHDFYDLVMARMAAGTCPETGFPTTAPPT